MSIENFGAGHTKHTEPCLKKAGDTEPIFVLRAQDRSSAKTLLFWMLENEASISDEKLIAAFEDVMACRRWPNKKQAD